MADTEKILNSTLTIIQILEALKPLIGDIIILVQRDGKIDVISTLDATDAQFEENRAKILEAIAHVTAER